MIYCNFPAQLDSVLIILLITLLSFIQDSLLYYINLSEAPQELFQAKLSASSSCPLFKLTNPHAHHHCNYERIQINHHFLCTFQNKYNNNFSVFHKASSRTVMLHTSKHAACSIIAVQKGMRWGMFFRWVDFNQIVQLGSCSCLFRLSLTHIRMEGLCSAEHATHAWSQTIAQSNRLAHFCRVLERQRKKDESRD